MKAVPFLTQSTNSKPTCFIKNYKWKLITIPFQVLDDRNTSSRTTGAGVWISGDIYSRFQNQGRLPCILCRLREMGSTDSPLVRHWLTF